MNKKRYIPYFVVAGVFMIKSLFGADTFAYAADFTGKKIVDVSISDKNDQEVSTISNIIKLKSGDTFNADVIQQDIKAIYGLGSFYDVQADFIEVPEGVKVVYSVTEKMQIKDIAFKGNTKISTEKLQSLSVAIKGNIIDNKKLNDTAESIEQYYHDQGYIVAKVNDVIMDQEGVVTFFINEGRVEDIVVKGNEKTKTYVITRELKIKTGEPFNAKDAKRSLERLNNLGFFEDVNMKLNPGREPNAVVPEVDVTEQKTGTFTIGGGYSKTDGLTSIIGLGDTNFRGTGNNLNVNFQHGYSSIAGTGWNLNFTNPYIDKKETSLSVNLFNSVNEVSDYGLNGDNTTLRSTYYRRSRGFNVTLGRPQGEYIKNYLTLTKRTDLYIEHESGPVDYSAASGDSDYNADYNAEYLKNNFGEVHSITLGRVYDTRDNVFNPTQGNRVSLTTEIAGKGLGGQFDFNKYIIDGRKYFKVGSKQVMAFHVSAGVADGDVPDASRFSVGGIDTLRGYKDEEFKGNKMFTATAEYRYPIANKVEGVVFADAGNAWDGSYNFNDLKYSIGTGLRVNTPIGPIRLDYGYGKEGGRAHFSFGTQF